VRAQHPNKRGETALNAGNCAVCAEGTERLELIKRSETLIKRGEMLATRLSRDDILMDNLFGGLQEQDFADNGTHSN
jgi:hypothetical protein